MIPKYFDIHSHLNFPDYDSDRKEVIEEMKRERVFTTTIGTNLKTSEESIKLAKENENLFACVGVHPSDTKEEIDFENLEELAKEKEVVCIGETGIDSFHCDDDQVEFQKEVFKKHIEISLKTGKPLMLHLRTGKGKQSTYEQALDILKEYPEAKGNSHFFAGTLDEAREFLERGFTISFTGVITFVEDYRKIIKEAPLEKIMAETDAPFVAPAPFRGKRNSPVYVKEVVKKIAEIKEIDEEFAREKLLENSFKFFNLSLPEES